MAPLLNQIQTWLKHPKVWRFVGFVSAVVGLLCYALGSSFNSLFGEWNLLKTFLYCVFSFIICSAVLFAKVWQHTSSLRLKAHMVFLVLTITSFYSFFFDKAANGKPGAYTLVSCAAFAVMSLSLSRQTHCGFELDLMYFFLGALIVQLMRIKWLLGIVGAGFTYSLIILRSYLDGPPEANRYLGLPNQPHVIQISSLESQSNASSASALVFTLQEGSTQDHAITEVDSHSQEGSTQEHAITEVDSHSRQVNTDFTLIKPQLLASIKALKKQNRKLIGLLYVLYDQPLAEPFQPDPNLLIDALPPEIVSNLNKTVKIAVAAGFEKECCHLYSNCRREFLRQFLSAVKLKDLDIEDNNDVEVENKIWSWSKAFNVALRVLFPSERRLCDRVFFGFSSAGDLSFVLVCKELTIHLLNFVNTTAVDICSAHEILVRVMRMFNDLSDMIPELESLFPNEYGMSLINEAIMARKRLGEKIRDVFKDLENMIRCDSAIVDVPGDIYPITRNVMRGLGGVVRVMSTIEKAIKEYPTVVDRGGTCPSLPAEMAWIVELLENHLEAKYKNYTEPALGYVARMNNAMRIKRGIQWFDKLIEIGEIIKPYGFADIWGDDWMQKHAAQFRQNLEDYQRSSWNEVLGLLKLDNNDESVAPDVAAESMKEKLKLFNIQFKEICSIHSKWFARDDTRKELIISLENMLLPAYGNFIGRFQKVHGNDAYKYIQYGLIDIQAQLNHLFLGAKRTNQQPK